MIITPVQEVPGVLPNPKPEALVVDLNVLDSDTAKNTGLMVDKRSSQHQMFASYERVLTAIVEEFHRSREKHTRAA